MKRDVIQSDIMKIHSIEIEIRNKKEIVSGKTTRQNAQDHFGEPDDVGGFSRKKKGGTILKYENTEFHFTGDKNDDRLWLIYREREFSGEFMPEISVIFDESSNGL